MTIILNIAAIGEAVNAGQHKKIGASSARERRHAAVNGRCPAALPSNNGPDNSGPNNSGWENDVDI